MSERLYIVPRAGLGTKADAYVPKYFAGTTKIIGNGQAWSAADYGSDGWFIAAANLNASDDALVIGQPDAFGLPFDLSQTLTAGQVTNVQTKLEAANIPAGWVSTGFTWRQVVHIVLGMFLFLQRFNGIWAQQNNGPPIPLFGGGITLSTTFGSLPLAVRTALISTGQSFGFDTSGLTSGTTIRIILKAMADAFGAMQFWLGSTKF